MSPPKEIINFFGEQRFSSKNVMLGKLLITKKFKEACAELNLSAERNDFVGALKSLGREKLKLYLHAYQSELWNRLAKKSKKKVLHIIGFLTEGKDYDNILKEEGITKENFILRAIPELSSEGTERKRIIPIKNFKTISFEDDELNPGKKKQVISFYLQKGAYATTLIEQLK
ncbi:tRNA pseudouridine(13) synthase TruD [Candidatus Woesearchaeota archaeon]|nr:tRNA pseudouridine(13) synthase TruD [Candidatus Woesearchaeota archaeon]